MFATAACLASQSVGKIALATQETQSPSVSPNELIHVAVVGAGGRGQSHIDGFAKEKNGTIVTHICDIDERHGQRACDAAAEKQNGKRPVYVADMRKLLEDQSIHAVSIATPNHWHALGAIWAVQAGKDVYVEKPVSHNVLEGRRLVQAARRHNRMVQTGTQCRSNPGIRNAMEFIHSGGIGEVKVARGFCYKRRPSIGARGDYPIPAGVNYDIWSGPARMLPLTRPRFHYDWHWQWEYGNGDLGNQGIHQMDLCRWALGENRLSEQVFSLGGRFGYEDAGETANTQLIVHDYGPKQLVFEVRGLETEKYKGVDVGLIVEGTDGYVVIPSYTSATVFSPSGEILKQFDGGNDSFHYKNFQDAVRARNHKLLTADVEEGHYSSALCHLGNISYQLGETVRASDAADKVKDVGGPSNPDEMWTRTVEHLAKNSVENVDVQVGPQLKFDPIGERFTENEKAQPMLTREYRKGYELPSENSV